MGRFSLVLSRPSRMLEACLQQRHRHAGDGPYSFEHCARIRPASRGPGSPSTTDSILTGTMCGPTVKFLVDDRFPARRYRSTARRVARPISGAGLLSAPTGRRPGQVGGRDRDSDTCSGGESEAAARDPYGFTQQHCSDDDRDQRVDDGKRRQHRCEVSGLVGGLRQQ